MILGFISNTIILEIKKLFVQDVKIQENHIINLTHHYLLLLKKIELYINVTIAIGQVLFQKIKILTLYQKKWIVIN